MSMETPTKNILRSFGLTMGAVFSLITGLLVYKGAITAAMILGIIALAFMIAALLAPQILEAVYKPWMKFATVVGNFNSKVILGLIFFTCFSFMRTMFFIFRKDPMRRKFEPDQETYWDDHPTPSLDPKRYEKQY